VAELGQGGMGRVLLAVAPDGRLVAVKQVHLELAEDAGFRARFRREVAASRKVSGAYTAAVLEGHGRSTPERDRRAGQGTRARHRVAAVRRPCAVRTETTGPMEGRRLRFLLWVALYASTDRTCR
jgi:hypothetical protein